MIEEVVKSRKMKSTAHVVRAGETTNAYRALVWKPEDHFEVTGVNGRVILKWTFKKQEWSEWSRMIWLSTETSGELL
jgi:hypothetical protein